MLTTRLKEHNLVIDQSFYSVLLDGVHAVQISITVGAHRAVLCVKRKVSVDPCWPSVYSAESCLISLGINAQRGTATVAAVQQPENSTFYSLSLSRSLPVTHVSSPNYFSSHCCEQVHSGERKYRNRRRRRRTALDLKKQQLRQPHCHSNICLLPSAAAGQFPAWEMQNAQSLESWPTLFHIVLSKNTSQQVWRFSLPCPSSWSFASTVYNSAYQNWRNSAFAHAGSCQKDGELIKCKQLPFSVHDVCHRSYGNGTPHGHDNKVNSVVLRWGMTWRELNSA